MKTVATPILYLIGPQLTALRERLLGQIDALWPDHPPVHAVTPGPSAENETWVGGLARGLREIRTAFPDARHVFVLIDDHCPLAPVDAALFDAYARYAVTRSVGCLHFVTYEWPWNNTDATFDPIGRVVGWTSRSVEHDGALTVGNVPPDFFRFYQVQPTLWDVEYLAEVCDHAAAQGVGSAWQFEEMLPGPSRRHCVAAYEWPCVHHGLLQAGRVNFEALVAMRHAATKPLADDLLKRFIDEAGALEYRKRRIAHALRLPDIERGARGFVRRGLKWIAAH